VWIANLDDLHAHNIPPSCVSGIKILSVNFSGISKDGRFDEF